MAEKGLSSKINDLFRREKWDEARTILERERERNPQSHWVLTQLGVTFYEQYRYEDALGLFLASLNIKDDCPLTLWNLAGALDALGRTGEAIQIYSWLLQSNRTSDDDPCWESTERTDALKSDCVFRIGVCLRHLGKKQEAERWLREYVNILLGGISGIYSLEDVGEELQKLHAPRKKDPAHSELRRIVRSTLKQSGLEQLKGGRNAPPKFSEGELLPGRRVASKK